MRPLHSLQLLFSLALTTALALSIHLIASGQTLPTRQMSFERLSENQGLSSNAVKQLFQDSKGFLWIITEAGMDRYDGIRFKHYRLDVPETDRTLPTFSIFEDREGVLWAGGRKGQLDRFDSYTDSFRKVQNLPAVFENTDLLNFASDGDGRLWIGTNHGLVRYDPVNNRADSFAPTPQPWIHCLTIDSFGQVWIGTSNGLRVLDQTSGRFERVALAPDEDPKPRLIVGSLLVHPSGTLFVGTEKGLFAVDTAKRKWKTISPNVPFRLPAGTQGISSLATLSDHTLILGVQDGGLVRLDLNGPKTEWIKHSGKANDSLAGDAVKALLFDRSGVLWVGDYIRGLSKYISGQPAFRLYRNDPFNDRTLSGNYIRGISESHDGRLWVSTQFNGVNLIDPKTGDTKRYQRATGKVPFDGTYAVLEDQAGDVWLGHTNNNGLARLNRKTDRFIRFPHFPLYNVTSIYEDLDRTLWVGTTGGVYEIPRDRKTILHHPEFLNVKDSLRDDIEAIFVDRHRNIWIGQNGKLLTFDRSTGVMIDRNPQLGTLPLDTYVCGFSESGDKVWIATKGAGAFVYDRNTDKISAISPVGGLPNHNVYGILEDGNGTVWISTDDGIVRYDPASGSMVQFGPYDGLQGKEFNRHAFHRAHNGDLYFGGTNGLNGFTPELIHTRNSEAPVVISSVSVNGVPRAAASEFNLDYTKNNIAVELAVLDFIAPELNRYEVKLEGVDKDWVSLGNESRVVYGNLQPRNYVLRVRGSNSIGSWKEALPILIRITPPWWRTGWAIGLYLFLTLGILAGAYATVRYRSLTRSRLSEIAARAQAALAEKKAEQERAEAAELHSRELARAEATIRLKNEQLASLVQELTASEKTAHEATRAKSEFLASISHEIRTPLNAVLGMAHMLLRSNLSEAQKEHAMTIRAAGGALNALLDDVLDLSKIEAGALQLDLQPFDVRTCVKESVSLLSYRAAEKKIQMHYNVDAEVPHTIVADQNRLRQVLVNLLGNAVKFTDHGSVSLHVTASPLNGTAATGDYKLEFNICDTGIGIPNDKLSALFTMFSRADNSPTRRFGGTGLGLAISRRLTRSMGGDIDVESDVGVGSKFRAWIVAEARGRAAQAIPGESLAYQTVVEMPVAIKILVADDSDVNRYVMEQMLECLGLKADLVSSGPEVIEATRVQSYDVILMDVHMPGMDGVEVTRRIRTSSIDHPVRIIALTADVISTTRKRCLEAGMDAVLTKPIELGQLRSALLQDTAPEAGSESAHILNRERLETIRSLSGKAGSLSFQVLVDSFITQCNDTLDRLDKSFARGDLEQVAKLAHKFAGTAATLGAERMAASSLRLRDSSMSKSHHNVKASIKSLRLEYAQLCDELLAEGETPAVKVSAQAGAKV